MDIEERKLMHKAQKVGQFTDFAFLCNGTKIPVHKVIVCAQSKAFYAACASGFQEATSGVYDLSDYPLEFVELMVNYLYVGYYEDSNRDAPKLPPSTHLMMMLLAEEYAIQGLKSEAKSSYIRRLKQKDVQMEDFLQSLPVLYELPVAVSRDFIDAAVAHTREAVLPCICSNASMRVVDQIFDASHEFLKEMMMSIMSTPLRSRCSDCSKQDNLANSSQESQRSSQTHVPSAGSLSAPSPGINTPSTGSLFTSSSGTNAPISGGLFKTTTNAPNTGSLFASSSGTNPPPAGSLFGSSSGTNVSSPFDPFTQRLATSVYNATSAALQKRLE
ncbi:kelch 21 [Fusarium mexicanum]|uniref:Kelch 21 n=1 Tax=Fusarium mexicanum TaxID=751941 RepID=A0A8H5JP11_9HYPO|nr:kelch 21 [Fusarium mexicanum]